ncbi:hypothetical protein VL04_17360 [Chromobacterium violaceum]|uniref:hypothetical protein n=1 Tax=Chromobacterium violaceum TaxID=536 RepID=UPI0006547C3F|nr:hypothetical protein [Chromobacterium violaceum]KMN48740.1 hypothetical protein VK93_14625 [Chromobacterium violaceum]KMN87835.1 hypothetical protein VL02_00620 [Chromobacterium violaceum]KMN89063.1 hypothetical protein VL04_17360 [Chromobacterium violaceum]KMO05438.1 hypothetical protein VL16_02605 [Chromobacterium violaceum]
MTPTTDQLFARQTLQELQIEMVAVDDREIYCRYFDHEINISRDTNDEDWYIRVYSPTGMMDYDGWRDDSANKSAEEAVIEALDGALLHEKG